MDVAIIGAGNVGSGLTTALTAAGHTVTVTSTTPEEVEKLANDVGAKAARSNVDAVANGDVVILAVYYPSVAGILEELGDALDGKILIDVSNRTNEIPGLAVDGGSNAEEIQTAVPKARVVKAFNTVFASHLTDPTIDGVPLDGFVAGDDDGAREVVLELVGSIGLRPVNAGSLASARVLEAMEALNMGLQMRDGGSWNNGWKLLEPGSTR
jgi:NADPH-dependent F420 reductase